MLDYTNAQITEACAARTREQNGATMRDIILNEANILAEAKNLLRMIEEATGGSGPETEQTKVPAENNLIEMLTENRDTAERILKTVIRIRDRMW